MRCWAILLLMLTFSLAGCFGDDDTGDDTGDDGDDAMDGGDNGGGTGDDDNGAGGGGGMDMGDGDEGLPCAGIADEDREQVAITISAAGVFPVNPTLDPARVELPQCARVTVTYNNEDPNLLVPHDLVSPPLGLQTPQVSSGESVTAEFDVDLPAGEYPFYCAVGNHRDMGMEGAFVVS